MIEDALKIKKYVEKAVIAGTNFVNKDKKIEKKEDL